MKFVIPSSKSKRCLLCCLHRRLHKETYRSNCGCFVRSACVNVFLCAYDIILLAPSNDALMRLLQLVEDELAFLDMALNASKSVCNRYGPRFESDCSDISTNDGDCLRSVSTCRYLGVFLVASRKIKISLDNNKQKLSYRTQFVEGISVTLKSTLRVTQGHCKRNHWTDHTRLTVRRVIGR